MFIYTLYTLTGETLGQTPLLEQAMRTAVVAAAKGVKTLHADSYREAADALLDRVQPGDAVLVKASHGMALEKVLDIFYAEHKEAEV